MLSFRLLKSVKQSSKCYKSLETKILKNYWKDWRTPLKIYYRYTEIVEFIKSVKEMREKCVRDVFKY